MNQTEECGGCHHIRSTSSVGKRCECGGRYEEMQMNQSPEGLPEEFKEDWQTIHQYQPEALAPQSWVRWRAALEALAEERTAHRLTESLLVPTEEQRDELQVNNATLRALLLERVEKCLNEVMYERGFLGEMKIVRCSVEHRCDLCRKARAAGVGQK